MACEAIDIRTQRGWDSLIPFVQPACLGVPADLIVHNLRLSAIEFTVWTGWFTQKYLVDLQANVGEYPIDVYDCMRFLALRKVCYNQQIRYCPAYEPRCCEVSGNKFWFDDGQLMVRPLPAYDEPEALEVEIVVALTQDTCYLPESLYLEWAEPIAAGAIARCLKIPGQPFTDMAGSVLYEREFTKGKVRAKQQVERSRIRGPMKMVARRFV